MKTEPKCTARSNCAVCKKKRPPAAIKEGDPFCSNLCCRKFHGVVFAADAKATGDKRKTRPTAAQIPRISGNRQLPPRGDQRVIKVNDALK
jgi:hypothetical protein